MAGIGVNQRSVESVLWQDYRASNTGMVVFYASDPVSEVPIREVPEELSSPVVADPNYETGTYGLYGCEHTKIRSAFYKGKHRYIFFMTKYVGTEEEWKNKIIVTGFYRIIKTADAKKFHVRYLSEYGCLDSDACIAFRGGEVHFVSLEDSVVVNEQLLKDWEYSSKITRQTRIVLNVEQCTKVLESLRSKENAIEDYLYETSRLQPHDPSTAVAPDAEADDSGVSDQPDVRQTILTSSIDTSGAADNDDTK